MVTEEGAVSALHGMLRDDDHYDAEVVHGDADEVLLAYLDVHGGKVVADMYRLLREDVGFWYA